MTKPRKKTKQKKPPRAQGGLAAKAKKKKRQTAHRLAASKPEVQERIKRLRKRWRRAKREERRERVADLMRRGCTVRGLAEEIHEPESVVRYYKPVPVSPEKEKQEAPQTSVPLKGGPRPASPAPGKPAPAFSKEQSDGASETLASSRKKIRKLQSRPVQLPPKPVPKPPGEKEEPSASLRDRLSEIIMGFVRAKWGTPEIPVATSEIPDFLASLRTHLGNARPWIRPVKVPDRISIKLLLQITEPNPRIDDLDWSHNSRWIATTLVSLIPDLSEHWKLQREVDIAERELLPQPQPEPLDPSVDESGRQLKPYEMRLRQWARRISRESSKAG